MKNKIEALNAVVDFKTLEQSILSCRLCQSELPLGPKPILTLNKNCKILIAGQAPGSRAHQAGIPFDDPSGDRLRSWLGIDRHDFYHSDQISIVPMGFCYPGSKERGDLPPIKRCSHTWHDQILAQFEQLELILAIGQYAHKYHLPDRKKTLTETVKCWKEYWPEVLPLPHPSPRNNIWIKKNPWFETDLIPILKKRIKKILA